MAIDLPTPSLSPATVLESSDVVVREHAAASNSAFGEYKASTLSAASAVAPQTFVAGGANASSAVANYLSQVKTPAAADSRAANDAAWSDFESRYASVAAKEPTSEVAALRQMSMHPTALQATLVGFGLASTGHQDSFIGPVTPNQFISSSSSIAANLFPAKISVAKQSAQGEIIEVPVDAIGWFCNSDGSAGTQLATFGTEASGEGPQDGASDGDAGNTEDLSIPSVEFPDLELTGYTGSLDNYMPTTTASGKSVTTLGDFDENTSSTSDLTQPGINSVHIVDRTWIDAERWSITETLVMSFNLSANFDPTSTDSDDTSSGGSLSTPDAGSDDWLSEDHSISETSGASIVVTRSGFVILTFHAERGMTTPSAAGVMWSINLSFRDEASISLAANGGRTITPITAATASTTGSSETHGEGEEPLPLGSGFESTGTTQTGTASGYATGSPLGGSQSAGTGTAGDSGYDSDPTDGSDGDSDATSTLPSDLNSTSSWSFSIGLRVWVAGSLTVSSTPSIIASVSTSTGSEIERSISYSDDIQSGIALVLGAGWASASSSGDLNTPDPGVVLPAAPPETIDYFAGLDDSLDGQAVDDVGNPLIDIPADGIFDFDTEAARDAWSTDADSGWSPVSQPVGRGHQFGSSGNASTSVASQLNAGMSFNAKVRGNEQLTALSGSLRSGFSKAFGDQSQDNEMLVFSDGDGDERSRWNGTIIAGRNINQEASLALGANKELSIGLGTEHSAVLDALKDDEFLEVGGSAGGLTFETLTIEMATLTPLPNGGIQYTHDKLVDAHGSAGNSGGSLEGMTKLDAPDSGELNLEWDNNGYQLLDVSNMLYFHKIESPPSADDGGWQEIGTLREQTVWQFVYHGGGDTEDSLNSAGTVDSTGSAESGSKESITYSSVATNRSSFSGGGSHGNSDYLRNASYYKELNSGTRYDATSVPATSATDTTAGDDRVLVTGHLHKDSWGHIIPWRAWLRHDIASGTSVYHGEGGQTTVVPIPINYDPRNSYEHLLDGSTQAATDPDEGLGSVPPDYDYPSNVNANDTVLGQLGIVGAWYGGFLSGELQGVLNTVNGLQDVAVATSPLLWSGPLSGWDWSRGLITHESGTVGGWDDTHGWSKWAGANGVLAAFGAWGSSLAPYQTSVSATRLDGWLHATFRVSSQFADGPWMHSYGPIGMQQVAVWRTTAATRAGAGGFYTFSFPAFNPAGAYSVRHLSGSAYSCWTTALTAVYRALW